MDSNNDWRQRLYIMVFQSDTVAGRRFDGILLLIILASLVIVMLDSIDTIHQNYADVLAYIEWGFTLIFAIEYGLRLYCSPKPLRYAFSFYGLVDLLAIVPGILALYYSDAQYLLIIRIIRMLRIFRVLKLSPYLKQANYLMGAARQQAEDRGVPGQRVHPGDGVRHLDVRDRRPGTWLHQYSQGHLLGHRHPDHRGLRRYRAQDAPGPGDFIAGDDHRLLDHCGADGYFTAELASAMRGEQLHTDCPVCKRTAMNPTPHFARAVAAICFTNWNKQSSF